MNPSPLEREGSRRGGAGPARSWGWLLAAVLLAAAVNPLTVAAWWFRTHYLSPTTARYLWLADVLVLLAGILLSRLPIRRTARVPDKRYPVRFIVIVLVLDVIFFMGALELALRLFPRRLVPRPSSLGREMSWRERHARTYTVGVTKFRYRGIDAYSPQLGWVLKPDLRTPTVSSNTQGFRGTREYAFERPPATRRVLCVGDSFTFGEALTDAQTMPVQLEAELNRLGPGRWQVINLGVHGYGTDQQWLRLQQVGFRYEADVVVLGYFDEDFYRNLMSFRDYAKPYFVVRAGRLVLRNVPVPSPDELLSHPQRWPRWRVGWLFPWIWQQMVITFSPLGDLAHTAPGRVSLGILEAMRRAVRAHGESFILMTIPRPIRRHADDVEAMLTRWARESGTPYLNLRKAYLALPPTERARLYGEHWTPTGSAVTARLLARRILDTAGKAAPQPGEGAGRNIHRP